MIELDYPARDIARIVIEAPPVNALGFEACRQLAGAFHTAHSNPQTRAVLFTARGAAFCAGVDLGGTAAKLEDAVVESFEAALDAIDACPLPIVAAINGACIGGGLEAALRCDIRIASANAVFACAGVNVGLIASASTLPRLIGESRAKTMLLTGETCDAARAERWGLVTSVCPVEELQAGALDLAKRLASRAPLAAEATKRVASAAIGPSRADAVWREREKLRALLRSDDHREALSAMRERRKPRFRRS